MTNFDNVRDRHQTNSAKWDGLADRFGSDDPNLLAMWVADMDFDPAPAIKESLQDLAVNHVLGYTIPSDDFYQSQIDWYKDRHQVDLQKSDILLSPGVVGSIGAVIQAVTGRDDGVMIHDPAYNGFIKILRANKRKIVKSPLIIEAGKFVMDYDQIEAEFKKGEVKLFVLSNPHNPGGRVWTREELVKLADLCQEYGVYLISDEIHIDLTYPENKATSAYTLDEKYFDQLVVLHSATKTFNIAGVKCSAIFVKNEELKDKIQSTQALLAHSAISSFGLVATQAAFAQSRDWQQNLLAYLDQNRQLIVDFFQENLPQVDFIKPEATYLFWFDAKDIGLEGKELEDFFTQEGQVALVNGLNYGETSPTWMRLNFATSRENVQEGLNRIKSCFDKKQ